jgi:hypothetical protein
MNIKRETDHFDQPPYCSEVNPIERVCPYLKNLLAWGNFNSLDHPRSKLYNGFKEAFDVATFEATVEYQTQCHRNKRPSG